MRLRPPGPRTATPTPAAAVVARLVAAEVAAAAARRLPRRGVQTPAQTPAAPAALMAAPALLAARASRRRTRARRSAQGCRYSTRCHDSALYWAPPTRRCDACVNPMLYICDVCRARKVQTRADLISNIPPPGLERTARARRRLRAAPARGTHAGARRRARAEWVPPRRQRGRGGHARACVLGVPGHRNNNTTRTEMLRSSDRARRIRPALCTSDPNLISAAESDGARRRVPPCPRPPLALRRRRPRPRAPRARRRPTVRAMAA